MPLNFKGQSSSNGSGGSYGTHSTSSSNTTTRQRRNPADYGPFSSPHASFDDPVPFPPYAELPFTSLKRRRQLQENNSFLKWAMRAVLLSPLVVLILWSVAAAMFASTHHQVGHNSNKNSNNNNSSSRQQSRRNKRMLPKLYGNGQAAQQQPPAVYISGTAPLQDQQGNLVYNVNGNAMMMAPQQFQQQQLQGMRHDQAMTNQLRMSSGYQQQQQQLQLPLPLQQPQVVSMQQQGNALPALAPLGNGIDVTNVLPANTLQQGQQQIYAPNALQQGQQQVLQQQLTNVIEAANALPANTLQQGQQQVLQQQVTEGAINAAGQPQQILMATDQAGAVPVQSSSMAQQQLQVPQVRLDLAGTVAQQPAMTSTGANVQQGIADQSNNNNNIFQAAAVMQHQQQQQRSLDASSNNSAIQSAAVMQQVSGSSGATQDQLQASPSKQAVYFYDPNDTIMSQTGELLQMPTLVYDANGKAVPLSELQHQAPIYVQPPVRGASSITTTKNEAAGSGGDILDLLSPSARGASLVSPSAREASISMPQSWGASTSQDQSIIVATVAVMALLVGAVSARRLRSKSFLSACIENESLEDDAAYDDAYTTTAAASGAMGGDSSYNTFGGWKGDLEKFDV